MSFEWLDSATFPLPQKDGSIENLFSLDSLKFVAMFTDKFAGGIITEGKPIIQDYIPEYSKLLEMRIFCDEFEILWKRSSIGENFMCRKTKDSENLNKGCFFDEIQLIDIDKTIKNESQTITSIGGGKYTLAIQPDDDVVKIRNYIHYSEETGRAMIADFRIMKFIKSNGKAEVIDCG